MAKQLTVATPPGKGKAHKRNPVAQAEILRKGGIHETSKKAKRSAAKRELKQPSVRHPPNHQNLDPHYYCNFPRWLSLTATCATLLCSFFLFRYSCVTTCSTQLYLF